MVQKIRKLTLFIASISVFLLAQEEYYPPETFYGGGVGFSRMFLYTKIGQLKAFEQLGNVGDTAGLGLNADDFTYPFVINGGEGFSNVTGRLRLGGYAGVGSSFISGKPGFILFLDRDGNDTLDLATEETNLYTGDFAPDIQAKVSIWIGGATVEYVFPIFRGLEIAAGTLLGVGRLNLNISQSIGSPGWNEQFSSMLEITPEGYYAITDLNGDGDTSKVDLEFAQTTQLPSMIMGRSMSSRTGTFFNMQPYVAVKLQFLDRMGLRASIGFNLGQITKGTWMTDDRKPISDSPAANLNSLSLRTMIYFGL